MHFKLPKWVARLRTEYHHRKAEAEALEMIVQWAQRHCPRCLAEHDIEAMDCPSCGYLLPEPPKA